MLREQSRWESLDEVPARAHMILRTDRQLAETVDELLARSIADWTGLRSFPKQQIGLARLAHVGARS